ncbi:MAG: helix-turn-helix domain-containing protein [Burkholderiaceae bacterium]|nr:helix-turn-helix domain-containing protein [Burkholderiaceae bacterium]
MKKSGHSNVQIVGILRELDRHAIPEIAKRNGVSEAHIYAWRKRFLFDNHPWQLAVMHASRDERQQSAFP